ncbi:winged helix-turn-helix domain-containing protein [Pantoea sp. JGM49]|nr:winged helix-turn-helix domain-containing protein [Pantoea sp. JGM49]
MIIIIDDYVNALYVNRRNIKLTKMEYTLYSNLMKNKKTKSTVETLIRQTWPRRFESITQNNLSQLAFKLKRKLCDAGILTTITVSLKSGCKISHYKPCLIIRVKTSLASRLIQKIIIHKPFKNN